MVLKFSTLLNINDLRNEGYGMQYSIPVLSNDLLSDGV